MPVIDRIAAAAEELTAWRRDLHAHPETAFEEYRTAEIVAAKLQSFGIEVHRGLAGTGVVGRLTAGQGNRAVALRADMDALHIAEQNDFAYKSNHDGKMHACGHDGHTTMLLGAARYLAETKDFDGTIYFIFQPAEENEGGARVMIEQGLFDKFPVEAVYGMHNMPHLPAGQFAVRSGPMMAAFDVFELIITGHGSHAAMPHQGTDPIVIAAQIVTALQTIVSRTTNPLDAAVVSVTQIHAGDTWNVIPDTVSLRGTTRAFRAEVQDQFEPGLRRIAEGLCAAHGARFELHYERRYPATVNTADETEQAIAAAIQIAGADGIDREPVPTMGAEDFAFMLQRRPGCYIWIGNGARDGGCMLHNPRYDFNDAILSHGASYWARLAESVLSRGGR